MLLFRVCLHLLSCWIPDRDQTLVRNSWRTLVRFCITGDNNQHPIHPSDHTAVSLPTLHA